MPTRDWWTALRKFSRAERPRAYKPQHDASFEPKSYVIFRLIDFVAQEMEAHRRRQAWVFREAIIVIGILTWATISIPVVRAASFSYRAITGGVTAFICIIIGVVSWYIVFLYRHRIYHLRKRREELVSYIRPEWQDEKSRPDSNRATWLFPPIGPPISSVAYAWLLLPVALLAAFLNVAAIWLTCDPAADEGKTSPTESVVHVDGQLTVDGDTPPAAGTNLQGADPPATPDGQ